MKNMILALSLLFAGVAQAQVSGNTITTFGTAEIEVDPTMAIYSMSVNTKAATVKDAQILNAKKSALVMKALTEQFHIQKKDLKNSIRVQKNQIYKNNEYTDDGFLAQNSISIRVYDLNKLGEILDVVGSLGAESGYVSYKLIDPQAAQTLALQAAAKNAELNAKALLQPYGKSVGAVIAIVQSGAEVAPRSAAMMSDAGGGGRSAPGSGGSHVSSGQITISASVSVMFAIK